MPFLPPPHLHNCAVWAVFTIGLFTSPQPALAQDDRLMGLLSNDFAETSRQHLAECDRGAAIIAALRGLPDAPTDAEMATFSEASQALFDAVASRAMRVPRNVGQTASVSPDGTRMLMADQSFDQGAGQTIAPYALFDPQTGAHIADLVSPDESHGTAVMLSDPAVFSPDSQIVAIPMLRDATIRLYSVTNGEELRRLTGLEARPDIGTSIIHLGFSADGTRYAAFSIGGIYVWDVASGAVIVRHDIAVSTDPFAYPIGWDMTDQVLVGVSSDRREDYSYAKTVIERWSDDGTRQEVLDLSAQPGLTGIGDYWQVSRFGPHLAVLSQYPNADLWTLDGTQIGRISIGEGVALFLPDGSGLVTWHPDTPARQYRRVDLQTGAESPAGPRDHVPFLHIVCDMAGQPLGLAMNRFGNATYLARDVPLGPALYNYVWDNLPQAVRDAVAADRVSRN